MSYKLRQIMFSLISDLFALLSWSLMWMRGPLLENDRPHVKLKIYVKRSILITF